MTDSDDKLSRRYRELPREEPPAALDAAILAASRRAVGARPSRASRWMVPASIAAVLVLGIGVSLRMQLEQPGIETSAPSAGSAEYPVPSAEPAPPPPPDLSAAQAPVQPAAKAPPERKESTRKAPAAPAERPRNAVQEPEAAKPLAKREEQPATIPAPASPPAAAAAPQMAPAPQVSPAPQIAPAPAPQAAPKVRRESFAADSASRESRALGVTAEQDPARELERIAKLREAARHEEADRALAEFRRRHPDYRIPDAVWERVKPR